MAQKVLIVGGAGYVGGYTTDLLLQHGFEVSIYDSLIYENRYLKPISLIYGDVRDRKRLAEILPKFDVVIWLAAVVGDGACALDPFLAQSINADSVEWLCENFGKRIIFTSTCSVYGAQDGVLVEDSPTNPLSVYAATKLAAESCILQRQKEGDVIFRLGTLFGVGDTYSRIRFDLVVNTLTRRATTGEPLTVFGGDQWRPLLHVRDVSLAFLYALQMKHLTGTFNLHYDNFTIKEIATQIQNHIRCEVRYQDMKFEDARNYRVSSDKFRSHGWQPEYSMERGIIEVATIVREKRLRDVHDPVYSNAEYLRDKVFVR
jgi:nucleoside-diphosphate-sugar epimerase